MPKKNATEITGQHVRPLKTVHLIAEGKRGTCFYTLSIAATRGTRATGFIVHKASGVNDRTLDREAWFRGNREAAEALFDRILREKLNPKRRSPRRYRVAAESPAQGKRSASA